MKTKQECELILGVKLVSNVERSLINKGVNNETVDRVLDYLALHKQAFPYIEIDEVARRMCDNLTCSICYNGMKESLRELFKFKRYGYSTGEKVVLNSKPLRFILPKKKFDVMLDALIRHELDHIATTRYIKLSREEYEDYMSKIIDGFCNVLGGEIDCDKETLIERFKSSKFLKKVRIEDGKKTFVERNNCVLRLLGVSGSWRGVDHQHQFGSTALNEGITAYKMKQLDKLAGQGGVMCQSGYILGEKVAEYLAETITERRLVELQTQNDFCAILEEYRAQTGESGNDLQKILIVLESKTHKSAFSKLFSQIRYGLTQRVDRNTRQKLEEITQKDSDASEM